MAQAVPSRTIRAATCSRSLGSPSETVYWSTPALSPDSSPSKTCRSSAIGNSSGSG